MIFKPITAEEAKPVISKWHYVGSMPGQPDYCYGVEENGNLIAAAVFVKMKNREMLPVLEFICHAKDPSNKLQMSQLSSYCCKELRKAGEHLLVTFSEEKIGTGSWCRASHWRYDGRRNWSGTEFRLEAEPHESGDYHIYWMPLSEQGKNYAMLLGLRDSPYITKLGKKYAGKNSENTS